MTVTPTVPAPSPSSGPRTVGRVALAAGVLGVVLAVVGWVLDRTGTDPDAGADIGAGLLILAGVAVLALAAGLGLVAAVWQRSTRHL